MESKFSGYGPKELDNLRHALQSEARQAVTLSMCFTETVREASKFKQDEHLSWIFYYVMGFQDWPGIMAMATEAFINWPIKPRRYDARANMREYNRRLQETFRRYSEITPYFHAFQEIVDRYIKNEDWYFYIDDILEMVHDVFGDKIPRPDKEEVEELFIEALKFRRRVHAAHAKEEA